MPKLKPCERHISITVPTGRSYFDTARNLSLQNRMSFRQGMEFAYDGIEMFSLDPDAAGLLTIHRLPNTWVTVNAWNKAFSVWRRQRREALDESETWSTVARYEDFKIYFNSIHAEGSYTGTPVPELIANNFLDLAGAQAIDAGAGIEWDHSVLVVPNVAGVGGTTEEYFLSMIGEDDTTKPNKGLIKAYAESRARPFPIDPSTVDGSTITNNPGGLYAEVFDVGENMVEVMENIRDNNESPPYVVGGVDSAEEFYPWGMQAQGSDAGSIWGVLQDYLVVRTGSTFATDTTGPFTALCGLIGFDNASGSSLLVNVKVAAGPYKGVMARPMQEVN